MLNIRKTNSSLDPPLSSSFSSLPPTLPPHLFGLFRLLCRWASIDQPQGLRRVNRHPYPHPPSLLPALLPALSSGARGEREGGREGPHARGTATEGVGEDLRGFTGEVGRKGEVAAGAFFLL